MEGRRAHAVAHLAYARSQKSGTGILGSKRVLQGGEKSSPLVVLCDLWLVYGVYGLGGEKMWSGERNYGLGSSAGGGKYGPGSQTAGLGQALVAGSMVQGAKLRPRVKPRRSMVQGAKPCPRVTPSPGMVQGEKLRPRVKPVPARVWSREPNCGFGSSTGGGKCGPGSQTAALGQARPRQSMVQGAKLRPRSPPAPPKCGPGSKTVPPGQARPRPSVV